jgi:S-formylglutathione hydrolase FrmB
VKLVPISMSFGRVLVHRSTSPRSATLTNTGTSILNVPSIGISGTNPQDYSQTNTCGPTVNAGMSCTISATFTPSAIGTRSASVSITDSSTDSPQLISLAGIGYTSFPRGALAVNSALSRSSAITVPSPTGPFTVGTRVLDLTDTTRDDPYLSDGTKREIAVRLWYPASLSQPCKPAEYTSPAVWKYFSQLTHVRPFRVYTNSCVNAAMADAPHPVVVFTPGYTATFTDYTFLLEDLASRGYVVASVDHTYEATAVEFSDGRLVKSVLGSHLGNTWRGDETTFSSATLVRLQDFEFVLNELSRLNAQPGGPFANSFDLSKVAIAGHSMGGVAALLTLKLDTRFQAAVMLDAAVAESSTSGTNKPVLMVAAGRSQWEIGECRLWKNLLGPRLAANFAGTEHAAFSDWIWLADTAIETGPMGPEKTMAAVRDYVAAFLDASLRQESPKRLLTGPSPDYPDVTLTTQQQSLCPEK